MSARTERFDERVLAAVPTDGGVRDATQIWEMLGGRWGWTGLFMGPEVTAVMRSLERLAIAGSIREQRVERAPGRFHRIYDRRIGATDD
jgi:hypothetical protein